MSTLSRGALSSAVVSRRANGGARRAGIVGMGVLALTALGADPVANANTADFLAAVQAAGITGAEPAMLVAGEDACDDIWQRGYTTTQVAAAAVQKNDPALTSDQAISLLKAAYEDLCPTAPAPGQYDWWAYSTG
jgi:Protein of unknown function (DUF732)